MASLNTTFFFFFNYFYMVSGVLVKHAGVSFKNLKKKQRPLVVV